MELSKLIVATNNKNKTKEIKEILKEFPIEIKDLKDENIDVDIEETGSTFEENAMIKAREIYQLTGAIVIADDSGLEVDKLDGAPGIYSARFSGVGAKDEDNNKKLLSLLEGVEEQDRTGRFVCAIAIVFSDGSSTVVRGECEGKVAFSPMGEGGFGYDPLFIPNGYSQSFGQLSREMKNSISHRSKALQKVRDILRKEFRART